MNWWYILSPVGVIGLIWLLTRPVRREVQQSDFDHWFREVLINSKMGAWVEIVDVERHASLRVKKLDRIGREILMELAVPVGADVEELARSMREGWEDADLAPSEISEGTDMGLRVLLVSPEAVNSVAAAAGRFFEAAGSVPGCRFRLRAKGRTDPEAIRPLVKSMQHQASEKRSKAWGKALEKSLDEHRDRQ